ncbi:hypothetical protein [Yoonia sp. 208BN28-4]|uniref:hypothetical protein n=1 Tax=Yoonia sp. 208BN28-4 TaxID=3126505 RepID=UPI0030A7ABD7
MIFHKTAIFALGLLASPLAAQDILITPTDLYAASVQALREGRPAAAAEGADALLSVAPSNVSALLLRTETAIVQEDYATAITRGRQAFWEAEGREATFTSARLVALAHARQGNDTRAQIWLRLARQFAPNAAAAQGVAEDYQFLRNRNPWSTSFRFGITPSSNINNGSASETTQPTELLQQLNIFFGRDPNAPADLSGDAQALSGYEISGGFNTAYRLRTTDTSGTFLTAAANYRTYRLSDDAREQAPDAEGSDYADANLTFGVTHRFIGRPGDLPTSLSFQVSQNWYADEPYSRSATLTGSHAWNLTPTDRLNLSMSLQRTVGLQDQDPINSFGITGSWTHAFSWGDTAQFTLGLRESDSDTLDSDYTSYRVAGDYNLAEPILGFDVGFGLEYEERLYDDSRFDVGVNERTDRTTTARMRAVVSQVELFGFQPVVTFEATRQESSIDLFDREYTRVGFDLQSSF